ncbi:MAG: hypothetical protein R3C18_12640 [Planctomycetaceae bacterium]
MLNVTVELDDPALGSGPEQTQGVTINLTDVESNNEQDAVVFDPATNRWWSGRNVGRVPVAGRSAVDFSRRLANVYG